MTAMTRWVQSRMGDRGRADTSDYANTGAWLPARRRRAWGTALALLASLGFGVAAQAAPTAPGSLAATAASSTQMRLTWSASTDTVAISFYTVLRCQGTGCTTFAQVGTVATGTTYLDASLTPNTTYQYEVFATDVNSAASPNSNVASATTFPASTAGTVNYSYDALGRLVQASVPALNMVETYTYDAGGNLTSVVPSPLSTLNVTDLSSPQGAPGGTITIFGSGFSTTPSSNLVKFNGTSATVIAATSTALVVTVPTGATSGAITVQTSGAPVTSSGTFTVTTATPAPTIAFIPSVALPGSIITVNGTGFQTNAATNTVQFNATWATVVSATATSLNVLVPISASSGPVTITTPYGSVTSAASVQIDAITPVNGSLTAGGAPFTLTLPNTIGNAYLTFVGTAGANLTLGVTNDSFSVLNLSVSALNGNTITTATVHGNGSLQIPALPQNGTYTVQIVTSGSTGSATFTLGAAATGTLTLNGSAVTPTLSIAGQSALLTFSGTAGAYDTLTLGATTLTAGTLTVLNPDGTALLSSPITTSGVTLNMNLPQTGTYSVSIVPTASSALGSVTLGLTSTVAPTLTPNQAPVNITLTNSNPTTFTFGGAIGQFFSIAGTYVSGSSLSPSVTITNPDGTTQTPASWSVCSSCSSPILNLGPLTESGTYSITVQQSASSTGTFALTLATPVSGTATLGTSTTVTVLAGQGVMEQFSAAAGQYVTAMFGMGWPGTSSTQGTVSILDPAGKVVASVPLSGNCTAGSCAGAGVANAGPLLTSGVYSALMQQTGTAVPGTVSVALTQPVQGTLTMGASNSVTVGWSQGAQETFTATAGQTLSVDFSMQNGAPAGNNTIPSGQLQVLDPNGLVIGSAPINYVPAGVAGSASQADALVNVGPLALSGTYTALLLQGPSGEGSGVFMLLPQLFATGSITIGTPLSVPLGGGQGLIEALNATTGQYLSIDLSYSSSNFSSIGPGEAELLSPSGAVVTSAPFNSSCTSPPTILCGGGTNLSAGPLPATGTYQVLFEQLGGPPQAPLSSMMVTASAPATGTLVAGTPTTVTVTNDQSAVTSFSGTSGQYATLTVSETGGGVQSATITVVAPNGTQVASSVFTGNCSPSCSGSTTMNLGPLPANGTYTVVVEQPSQAAYGTGPLTFTLTNNAVGTGVTQALSTSTAGQAAQFTYVAAAGEIFHLALTNMVFTPSSVTNYSIQINDPSGTGVGSASCSGATCTLNVPGFTLSGTYTVIVTPQGAATLTGTATLSPIQMGTLTIGTLANLTLGIDQGAQYTFTATAGQTLALDVSSFVTTPANTYYQFYVYGPGGQQIAGSYTQGATTLNLPNLAAGTYTFSIVPSQTPASSTMQVTVAQGVVDALPLGGIATNVTTSVPGEIAYVTIPATFGQSYSLALSNVTLNPAGGTLTLTRPWVPGTFPEGGATCMAPSCVFHYSGAPNTQTYTAIFAPPSNTTLSMTAALTPDVTGTLVPGTPFNLTLSETGQSAILLFNVTAQSGQSPSLYVTNVSPTPNTATYNVAVYSVNQAYASVGGTVTASAGTTTTLNLPNLAPGSYAVVVTPTVPAVATLQLTVEPTAGSPVLAAGGNATLTTVAPGEAAYLSFVATAGQTIAIGLTNLLLSPSSSGPVALTLYGPGGQALALSSCTVTNNSCEVTLASAPLSGNYLLVIQPPTNATLSTTANIPVVSSGTLTVGTPATVNWTTAGQSSLYTFTLASAQSVAVNLGAFSLTPPSTSVTVTITNSSGTTVATLMSATGATTNLQNLPAGTYGVAVTPAYPVTGSLQLAVEPAGGSISVNGSSTAYSTPVPGEIQYLTFSGTAGQSLSLALTNLLETPSTSGYMSLTVYQPSGAQWSSTTCYVSSTASSCEYHLRALPATGTYTVVVQPAGYATLSYTLTASLDASGTLTSGTASTMTLASVGQSGTYSFTLAAAKTIALYLGAISVTPANTSLTLSLYNSSGTQVASSSSATPLTLNQQNLAAGTYTAVVVASSPVTGSVQLTLEPQTGGTLSVNGSSHAYSTPVPGQNAYFSFSGTAGQSLSLAFTNVVQTPNTSGIFTVYVYQPSGSQWTSTTCSTSSVISCEFHLRNAPATGTYTVIVLPGGEATLSFTLTATLDATATLTAGTAATVTLGSIGQSATATFTATASENVTVTLSSISVTPSGTTMYVYVYNSSGSLMGSTSGTTSATLSLSALAAGAYSIVVVPGAPVTGSFQVKYQ